MSVPQGVSGESKVEVRAPGGNSMGVFRLEPIGVDASAPGGARVLRTFDDVAAFIADSLDTPRRQSLR